MACLYVSMHVCIYACMYDCMYVCIFIDCNQVTNDKTIQIMKIKKKICENLVSNG